jgi:hypothetical protein
MKFVSVTDALLLCGAGAVMAQEMPSLLPTPSDMKWGPSPPTLSKGAEIAV